MTLNRIKNSNGKSIRPQDQGSEEPDAKRFRTENTEDYLNRLTSFKKMMPLAFTNPSEDGFRHLHETLKKNSDAITLDLLHEIISQASYLHYKNMGNVKDHTSLTELISFTVSTLSDRYSRLLENPDQITAHDITQMTDTIRHLGHLTEEAYARNFEPFNSSFIQKYIDCYIKNIKNDRYQYTGNELLPGLALLAKSKKIVGEIEGSKIQSLLEITDNQNGLALKAYIGEVCGIGLISKSQYIKGKVQSATLVSIINKFYTCRDITQGIYNFALLAQNNNIDGVISNEFINQTLRRFNLQQQKNHQDIANTAFGLSILATYNIIQGYIDPHDFLAFINSKPLSGFELQHLHQLHRGICQVAKSNNNNLIKLIPARFIRELTQSLLNTYNVQPTKAAYTIINLSVFSCYSTELNSVFEFLTKKLTLLDRLPSHLQPQLKNILTELESTCPSWHKKLESCLYAKPSKTEISSTPSNAMDIEPKIKQEQTTLIKNPVHTNTRTIKLVLNKMPPQPAPDSTDITKIIKLNTYLNQNKIRVFIENTNFKGLSQLLNSEESHSIIVTHQHLQHDDNKKEDPIPFKKRPIMQDAQLKTLTKQDLVLHFFKETDDKTLGNLARKSSHVYFDLLLQACSPLTCYQLFITQKMHPVLIELPIKELNALIDKLISSYIMKCKDPRITTQILPAVIQINNAFMIRSAMHPNDTNELNDMSERLLKKTIQFYDDPYNSTFLSRKDQSASKSAIKNSQLILPALPATQLGMFKQPTNESPRSNASHGNDSIHLNQFGQK